MLIISKFKDYYDRVQKQGQDKSIVFNRMEYILPEYFKSDVIEKYFLPIRSFNHYDYYNNKCFDYSIIVVCGIAYLMENSNNIVLTQEECNDILANRKINSFYYNQTKNNFKDALYVYNQEVYDLCLTLNTPIFRVFCHSYFSGLYIDNTTPILQKHKFERVLSAEQVFQSIEQFIISKKSCNPPVDISDKEKIKKAGFDIKQSFRHRK